MSNRVSVNTSLASDDEFLAPSPQRSTSRDLHFSYELSPATTDKEDEEGSDEIFDILRTDPPPKEVCVSPPMRACNPVVYDPHFAKAPALDLGVPSLKVGEGISTISHVLRNPHQSHLGVKERIDRRRRHSEGVTSVTMHHLA